MRPTYPLLRGYRTHPRLAAPPHDCFCPCCLQRFRFTTSLLYTACVSCEFLTPRFPSHFLLLTAVSNVGRAVGLTTFVSTQPAFQQALCASGNMADLASKTQVQQIPPGSGLYPDFSSSRRLRRLPSCGLACEVHGVHVSGCYTGTRGFAVRRLHGASLHAQGMAS
eukprot:GHRQ01024944.1.p1 GENE.GHRQ01024944.1~~GHRQ01024944.1.p1  ORF type:complete len:166 (-),score=19.81 GHRQ01024944.1:83-580(-)